MIAEPQEFYDLQRRERAEKQLATLGEDALQVICYTFGLPMNNNPGVLKMLLKSNEEMLENAKRNW